jgi:hypothetical protein
MHRHEADDIYCSPFVGLNDCPSTKEQWLLLVRRGICLSSCCGQVWFVASSSPFVLLRRAIDRLITAASTLFLGLKNYMIQPTFSETRVGVRPLRRSGGSRSHQRIGTRWLVLCAPDGESPTFSSPLKSRISLRVGRVRQRNAQGNCR